MELGEALRRRRMSRRFEPVPVAAKDLDAVLSAALRAPSAGFAQGLDLVVFEQPEERQRFWEAATEPAWRGRSGAEGLLAAPVLVLPVADPGAYAARYAEADKATTQLAGLPATAWPVPYWLVDAAFATMLMMLQATELHLGCLFFQLHATEPRVLEDLGIPRDRRLIGALALGHPAELQPSASPDRRARRTADDAVHRGQW